MKKFFALMVAVAAVFSFAACEEKTPEPEKPVGGKIETPVIEIKNQVADGFTAEWKAVDNAKSYSVVLSKANSSKTDTQNVTTTSVTFSNLGIGTYTVSVKAVANDGYKDSDYGKQSVTIEGLTEADWFEMTLWVSDEYESKGLYSFNTVFYSMKGQGVASVKCSIMMTETAASMTTEEIISKLQALGADSVDMINGANGLASYVSGVPASTEVVMYALAENNDGASVLVSKTATTTEVVVPEAAKPWIGTYEATVSSLYVYAEDKSEYIEDANEKFEFIVDFDASLGLIVDGFSVLGGGWETAAYIENDKLYVETGVELGESQGYTYAWLYTANLYTKEGDSFVPVEGEQGKFYSDNWASHAISKADAGYSCDPLLYDMEDGTYLGIVFSDIFAIQGQQLYFLIDAWPAKYRTGSFAVTKTSDEVKDLTPEEPATQSRERMNVMPTSYSVVY